jgi:putative ABC transport system substrate-binding protein
MRRREFITLLSGAGLPFAAHAQRRMSRVGILLFGAAAALQDLGIVRELARIGFIEGRNIDYELRAADSDVDRLPLLARELAAAKPDAIVGSGSPTALALAAATRDIPIVMMVMGDPIALGLSNSISRPSGNVTGFPNSSLSLAAKRLELLRDLVPTTRKVAYLWARASPIMNARGEQVRAAAGVLGIELVSLPLKLDADIAAAFALADKEHVTAVLVESDALTVRFGGTIMSECLVRNLPAMHAWPFEVRAGALMAYGPTLVENYPRTAVYIQRILRGAKVAELPFEEPTHIALAINLRTARSIGIAFPPELLARANEVIE